MSLCAAAGSRLCSCFSKVPGKATDLRLHCGRSVVNLTLGRGSVQVAAAALENSRTHGEILCTLDSAFTAT